MAWDLAATAAVGIAGIAATYFGARHQATTNLITSRESNATALEVSKHQSDAQLSLHREERLQRRLEEAYYELLMIMTDTKRWAVTQPYEWEVDKPYTPDYPAATPRVEALVQSMWSPRVQQLATPWNEARAAISWNGTKVNDKLEAARQGLEDPWPGEENLRSTISDAQSAVLTTEGNVKEQIWKELRGEHDGHAEAE